MNANLTLYLPQVLLTWQPNPAGQFLDVSNPAGQFNEDFVDYVLMCFSKSRLSEWHTWLILSVPCYTGDLSCQGTALFIYIQFQ